MAKQWVQNMILRGGRIFYKHINAVFGKWYLEATVVPVPPPYTELYVAWNKNTTVKWFKN